MDELLKIAAANQQRAREVIRDTDLEAIWQQVGAEPNLVGSLRTGLLMSRCVISSPVRSEPTRFASAPTERQMASRSVSRMTSRARCWLAAAISRMSFMSCFLGVITAGGAVRPLRHV